MAQGGVKLSGGEGEQDEDEERAPEALHLLN